MKMPGISDAERLSNLKDELNYAKAEYFDALKVRNEAQRTVDFLESKLVIARDRYERWLEMMAAGVTK